MKTLFDKYGINTLFRTLRTDRHNFILTGFLLMK